MVSGLLFRSHGIFILRELFSSMHRNEGSRKMESGWGRGGGRGQMGWPRIGGNRFKEIQSRIQYNRTIMIRDDLIVESGFKPTQIAPLGTCVYGIPHG